MGASVALAVSVLGIACKEGRDGGGSVGEVARERSLERSMLERRFVAARTRVGVGSDMTPSVRWRVVRGRMADGWKRGVGSVVSGAEGFVLGLGLASVFAFVFVGCGLTAKVMSEVKCWMEACSLGLEVSVTSGIQRKCVSGGLGGMAGLGLLQVRPLAEGVILKLEVGIP